MTVVAGFVFFAASYCWLFVGITHEYAHPVAGWLLTPVTALIAARACHRVSRRADLAVPTTRFWRHMGLASLLMAAGAVSNMVDAVTGPHAPSQYVGPRTIVLYLCTLLATAWAMLRLPTWQRGRGDWARLGLDAGTVLITSGGLIWYFSLRDLDVWTSQTGSPLSILLITVLGMVAMVTLIKVALAGAGQLDRGALYIMSVGSAASAFNGALTPLFADRPWLSTSVTATTTASLGVQLAAMRQLRAPAHPPADPLQSCRVSAVPYLAVAAMIGVLISVVAPHGGEDLTIALCAAVLVGLVVIRQILALRENGRLLTTVDANLRQLRAYQEQLDHQISHDTLTQIANRASFTERVTGQLGTDEPFHVALLDIDDFKTVNDRLGHGTGDALLQTVSRRLVARLRPRDTVARLGGDEFTLLLPGRTPAEVAELLGELVEAVREPFALDGQDLSARVSVGVTASQPGDTPGELLRRADVAMYAAKSAGGGRWTWFDPLMDNIAAADARLSADLRQALVRDELFVLYQPIVALPDGELAGVEALVRWRHPEHGLVSPGVFIPLAERNGFIVELGRWVLREVVRQAAEWERTYGDRAPQKVSVNISARQLREPGFPAEVAELLRTSGLDPRRLVAEVTETAVLGTGEALNAVRALHELGLRVALDDFGTGQSSLSLLVDTPVKILKVDKSFVDGVTTASPAAVIVDGLIGITGGLRIEAVAEGVETAEQAERLHRVGYRLAQGFHFAKPMPAGDVALLLGPAIRETQLSPLS